ncbi:hypothetical protein B0H94_108157 [Salsuginibacillus halophilus]|uniref:Uncharacterized protein n=1 Tax=Salsuginibacillus halophilus TaxID=517424 RepID=A0A2P8HEB7_9BACI|nr:hypothetical protein [Salsuginibacillus halophilus]PSL44544.1 hypothetical protein B0H94_108157 [Salsuginibacillus halophilus]
MELGHVVNFERLRNDKQQKADEALLSVYHHFFDWLQTGANLRDKVRAKHMFKTIASIDPDEMVRETSRFQFEHWFAFDYSTIIGAHLFDLFIRQESQALTSQELETSGVIMTTALELFQIEHVDHEGCMTGKYPLTGEERTITPTPLFAGELQKLNISEGLCLLRTVQNGFSPRLLTPPAPIQEDYTDTVIDHLQALRPEKVHRQTFMRKNSLYYLSFVDWGHLQQ